MFAYIQAYTLIKKITTLFQTVGYMDKQKEYVVLRIYNYLMVIFNNQPSLPDLLTFLLNNYRECCLHNNFIVCVCSVSSSFSISFPVIFMYRAVCTIAFFAFIFPKSSI